MLKSYEAIYSQGRLHWLNQPPHTDEEIRVLVVMEISQESQQSKESLRKLLKRTRGSMGHGRTLDDIDTEVRTMRHEWERR